MEKHPGEGVTCTCPLCLPEKCTVQAPSIFEDEAMNRAAFEKWWEENRYDLKDNPKMIWQYFAPSPQGEFPREASDKLIFENAPKT